MICKLEEEAVEAALVISEEADEAEEAALETGDVVVTTVVEPAICVVYDSTE